MILYINHFKHRFGKVGAEFGAHQVFHNVGIDVYGCAVGVKRDKSEVNQRRISSGGGTDGCAVDAGKIRYTVTEVAQLPETLLV